MKPIFAVGDAWTAIDLLPGKAILMSHAYLGTNWLPMPKARELAALAAETWLDCGAFTEWNRAKQGKPHKQPTVEGWSAFLMSNDAPPYTYAISLDVIADADASLRNWLELVKLLGPLAAKLVPVFHEGDPMEHLDAYDPNTRLVAIGRTEGRKAGPAGRRKTFEFYDAVFNAYPDGSIHLLGNSTAELIEPYPAKSFDATSWQRDAAYGESQGWPWNRVSKKTRMRAYIEAIETIQHRPVEGPAQRDLFIPSRRFEMARGVS